VVSKQARVLVQYGISPSLLCSPLTDPTPSSSSLAKEDPPSGTPHPPQSLPLDSRNYRTVPGVVSSRERWGARRHGVVSRKETERVDSASIRRSFLYAHRHAGARGGAENTSQHVRVGLETKEKERRRKKERNGRCAWLRGTERSHLGNAWEESLRQHLARRRRGKVRGKRWKP